MCGIVGFVGKAQAAPILLDGLERLEYRGYDSAGIAVCGPEGLRLHKTKGRLQVLRDATHNGADLPGTLGIGHTRWATHGEPNDINAHPHMSQSGKFALVHNGIIENYAELKDQLKRKGYTFRSETDTEVVVQLLDYYYAGCGDFFEAMTCTLNAVEGAYALGIICSDYPDRMIAARKNAPLLLGYSDEGSFIASDVTALIRHTRDIAYMDDGEMAILNADGIRVYDRQMRPVEKEHHHIDWEIDAAEKGGYDHFMLKEIFEQPEAIRKATAARIQDDRVVLSDLTMTEDEIRNIGRIYIIACGSSYHVGMVGKYNLERMLRRSVEVVLASEFRYCDPIVGQGDLVIVISQSGETLDTMEALREAKKRGARILSIVNVVGSSIARESDDVLYTWAGPEIAVATTKAYSTQMAVLNLVGLYFGDIMGTVSHETYTAMVRDLQLLPEKMEKILENTDGIHAIAKACADKEDVFFIGRNLDYALSLEGSLKLKEISYIHSEAYASGELKHGTISLIEDDTLVVALGTYDPLFDKAMSNVVEVQARGAKVLALTTETHFREMAQRVPMVLTIPEVEQMLLPQLGVVPLQLLAYYVALERGCDIDKPRNLAKSVTVE
ncbi:MAG: glutamine--fructose-6-phosphate transaminase (isomerizing) [Clostridiales bacterium]|nr:glutamine--fructose-6-phosphate transaminase (isomerizing) [Candidatus Cacconaster stercorequi]